jgi:predicted metal-binding membrane protein
MWKINMSFIIRNTLWLTFFAIILLSWWWLYSMSLSMNMDFFGRMSMDSSMSQMATMSPNVSNSKMSDEQNMTAMNSMPEDSSKSSTESMSSNQSMANMGSMSNDQGMVNMGSMSNGMKMDNSMTSFLPLFGMWAVMMAAMMLPTMVPTLKSYEDLMISADGTRIGWIGLLLGYSIIWVTFSALITAFQLILLSLGLVDMMGKVKSIWISSALLIIAGAFQFTRAKEVCHGICHSPMSYFLGNWKTGFNGGLRMGIGLGTFCVGCCWLFMMLGFAGGVMNFLWMGLATLFMVIEKLPAIGHYVIRPMGAVLIASGVLLFFLF